MLGRNRASKLIIIVFFSSILTSDAKPYLDEYEEDYISDLSELSRRAANPADAFPKFPGDYDEYPVDDAEDVYITTTDNIAPVDEVSNEEVEVPRKEEERFPWFNQAGKWIRNKYKKVKEEVPKVLEAGNWFKRQYKKLVNGYNEED